MIGLEYINRKEYRIMKNYKKIISIIIVFAMVMSLCIVQAPTSTKAAGVKIIVGKKLDVIIGTKDTILVKGKAKAKSAKKSIAKVTKVKKGKKKTTITVQGKGVGTTTIKVKVKKKSKKVKVLVRPARVVGLTATVSGTNIKLNWKKSNGATGYNVYRATSKNGPFAKVGTSRTTSFTNANVALGNTYYYKVLSYGNSNIACDEYSSTVGIKTWKMVWNDEFEGTSLDTEKWNNDGATGWGGYGNNEWQNYQMDYSEVSDGKFIIKPEIHWNKDKQQVAKEGKNYKAYSTKVWTKNQFDFTYGKIEFRAKMPKGEGTWAAGWMLGYEKNYGTWPASGEIDVFETTFQRAKTRIPQSIHTKKFNGMPTSSGNKHYDSIINTATSEYHTYGAEWYTNKIVFTIDGKKTGTYDPSVFSLEGDGTDDPTIWPYNKPFYLIMNCAIGGTLGMDTSGYADQRGNVKTVNPNYWTYQEGRDYVDGSGDTIEVYQDYLCYDWVRVYK